MRSRTSTRNTARTSAQVTARSAAGQQDPRKVWIYNAIHLRLSRTIQDLNLKPGDWAKRNGFFLLAGGVDLVLQRLTSIYLTKNFLLYFFLGENVTVGSYI